MEAIPREVIIADQHGIIGNSVSTNDRRWNGERHDWRAHSHPARPGSECGIRPQLHSYPPHRPIQLLLLLSLRDAHGGSA